MEDTVTYVAEPHRLEAHLADLERLARLDPARILPNHGDPDVIAAGGYPSGLIKMWDVDYHDMIALACSKVTRDFTAEERIQYDLSNGAPTCPQFGQGNELPPGMTAIPTQPIPVWTPIPTSAPAP